MKEMKAHVLLLTIQFLAYSCFAKIPEQRCICLCNADQEFNLTKLPFVNTEPNSAKECECKGTVGTEFKRLVNNATEDSTFWLNFNFF